jgi:2-iminobutanoate/2-iminopropanoate deaminase
MTQTFGPYTPVRKAGSLWFVSGQVGVNPQTKIASTNISDQTEQALSNLKDVLREQGLTMNMVVKTTIFITDMSNFGAVNAVYEKFFSAPRPARSTVEVSALPKVADDTVLLVEIEAVVSQEV